MTASACTYCGRSWRAADHRRRLRIHLAVNDCGHVPPGTCLPFGPDDPAGETSDLQPVVTAVAEHYGWATCHVYPTRGKGGRWLTSTTAKGFPDLWLLRPPHLIVLELKGRRGRLEPGQADWIADLDTVDGVTARFADPDDWPDLQQILTTHP